MMTAFNFDLTNTAHANAFASIMAIASANGVPFEMVNGNASVPVSDTSAKVEAPKPTRTLEPAKDEVLKVTHVNVGKGKVGIRSLNGPGSYGGKLMLKDAGFVWDETYADSKYHGAWVGTTAQAKAVGLTSKSTEITIPATWVQAGRDKAAAKAERKNR